MSRLKFKFTDLRFLACYIPRCTTIPQKPFVLIKAGLAVDRDGNDRAVETLHQDFKIQQSLTGFHALIKIGQAVIHCLRVFEEETIQRITKHTVQRYSCDFLETVGQVRHLQCAICLPTPHSRDIDERQVFIHPNLQLVQTLVALG